MKKFAPAKYLFVLTLPVLALYSFHQTGWVTYLPIIEAFVFIPLLELFFKPDSRNLLETEEHLVKKNINYDLMVYLMLPVQFICLYFFLDSVSTETDVITLAGRIASMGILCGVIGINVAHELGHRTKTFEQQMSKMLLITSLYMHFFIEHNRGHHKNVSTREDPASAYLGQTLYHFWCRSIFYSFLSAWHLESSRLKKNEKSIFSIHNQMLRFQFYQIIFLIIIGFVFGIQSLVCFLFAALLGILLLETVNYIEHYGLERSKTDHGYERVMPWHSWNSNHIVGRLMLFELSRHSDHHYIASRKYQLLRHMDESPQMPTGYPGMILLALTPPLWFKIMNTRIKRLRANV